MNIVDMKLEVVAIPVSDIERAKRFYGSTLSWRLDADFAAGDEFRGLQFTPRHSQCSIHFGKGVTPAGFCTSVAGAGPYVRMFDRVRFFKNTDD